MELEKYKNLGRAAAQRQGAFNLAPLLDRELDSLKKELEKREETIKRIRARHKDGRLHKTARELLISRCELRAAILCEIDIVQALKAGVDETTVAV